MKKLYLSLIIIIFFHVSIFIYIFDIDKLLIKAYFGSFKTLIILILLVNLISYVITKIYQKKPTRPLLFLFNDISNKRKDILLYSVNLSVLYAVFPIFIGTFSSWKFNISYINFFAYDKFFSFIDRKIHFNNYPHEILHFLNKPIITEYINFFYHAWFFVVFFSIIHIFIFNKNTKTSNQYILAFFLTWIVLGNFFATLLASVGPCFYDSFYPANQSYLQHMDYLKAASKNNFIPAISVQKELLDSHLNNRMDLARGISAMPSMHFASTLLLTIYLHSIRSNFFIPAILFLIIIFVGSIHLGYHYAIDSYFAIIPTILIWKISGFIMRELDEKKS